MEIFALSFSLLLVLGLPLVVIYNIWHAARRGRQFKELLKHGVEAQAMVTDKIRFRSNILRLIYSFQASGGKSYQHRSMVSNDVFDSVNQGSALDIVYLPENPAVNAPRYLVEQLRAGMAKHS